MTRRLEIIFSQIPNCQTFADVGCDHGYISQKMLLENKCHTLYFSDISKKCLEKAQKLLKPFIDSGRAKGYVSNGFIGIPQAKIALIAGMGGEEIIKILSACPYKVETLVLQPMKNCDLVRIALLKLGYKIDKDFLFKAEDKFYNLIVASLGACQLSADQIEFGKDNLDKTNPDFLEWGKIEIEKIEKLILSPEISNQVKKGLNEKLERIKKYVAY